MIFAAGSAFDHVLDSLDWHLFESLHLAIPLPGAHHWPTEKGFGLTKYSILMFLAGGLICWIYIPLAKRIQTGEAPKGTFWNLFESVLVFIRDEVAKPYIGKDADRYVPYLWTTFLFVLVCNLLGMIPFMGSPTASFAMTSVLAFGSFILIHAASIARFGVKSHLLSFAPDMDMPLAIKLPILIMLWPIEFIGLMLKCFVLAVRLFANMFAGHMVLATILLFIPAVANSGPGMFWGVTAASVFGVIALSLLELFVAFLQAYLFTFLTALFLGGVLEHAEHVAHAEHDHQAGEEDVHLKGLARDDHGHGHHGHAH
ncbi:MAG: F0F1 ATP synthase subunit A [Verrucomicrobiae bacterium]|nr:F0F1 ATP synthase subunit A [Verrucomicrobiae bacterium]